ncbi:MULTISPECIES: hypothetical protein [unclassified Motilimonas]|uniref:hypothetical protein n=1 Tax=Motilimonas TaxID=1914248 RepID=UPI001E2FCB95|nr:MULTISPECIES: hypothetical protein [unclassified Motilimonas]MCE0558742.1 hypothetical protein [Motilimonas sp. E26]MDO6525404.1 hypothetical protein [Motilimonas sp. 1_MG-2023]
MISRSIFRLLVLFFVFCVVMTFVTENMMPWQKLELISQNLISTYLPVSSELSALVLDGLLILSFVLVTLAVIGLLLFWGCSRWLFLIGYGVLILVNWLTKEPLIVSYLANIYTHLTSITGGFIICCVFFTNIRYYFIAERKIWS